MARTFSGSRLRTKRIAADIKPEQLALLIDKSAHSLYSYELGRVTPPVSTLALIADVLNCAVDELLDESPARVVA
jgi:transcriptional regulator with XRE-family HTH domain